MKTYFIAGRIKETDSSSKTASCSISARDGAAVDTFLNRSQISFKKVFNSEIRF